MYALGVQVNFTTHSPGFEGLYLDSLFFLFLGHLGEGGCWSVGRREESALLFQWISSKVGVNAPIPDFKKQIQELLMYGSDMDKFSGQGFKS